jgi:hypothetical protein
MGDALTNTFQQLIFGRIISPVQGGLKSHVIG